MTLDEKIIQMEKGIAPDKADHDVLQTELLNAETMILNKMYPFGYDAEKVKLPVIYERLQIKLAIELYTQRGADGQASHTENGITRTWPSASRILQLVVPRCGSVM